MNSVLKFRAPISRRFASRRSIGQRAGHSGLSFWIARQIRVKNTSVWFSSRTSTES